MDADKSKIVRSVLKFIKDEIEHSTLDAEQKESLDVARQCLESTYELDGADRSAISDAVDLYTLFQATNQVSEEDIQFAEEFKVRGNEYMKDSQYIDALEMYTKAIDKNPKNHVFYCNRAAAFSRLDKHWDAIADCNESIALKPTAKAYGRLGVAYSNMNMYKEAKEAYGKAHELDPSNSTYEENRKLAEELLNTTGSRRPFATGASFPSPSTFDLNNFISNPALLTMASQMLSDPSFRNMVSGIMSTGPNGDPNIDAFMSVGQQLAQQMQATHPNLMDNFRNNATSDSGSNASSPEAKDTKPNTDKPSEN